MKLTIELDSRVDRPKMPSFVKVFLCSVMIWPGVITYWLTSVPETYGIGTFYGVVCIAVFAACGIYHRRKLNGVQRDRSVYLSGRHAPNRCA